MSLVTLAIVNGVLVAALLAGLAYVCSIPFRIDRPRPRPVLGVLRGSTTQAVRADGSEWAATSAPAGAAARR
jgi:hypothetical protein